MRLVALLAAALLCGACDHEGPTVYDGRVDGPPRDGPVRDAPVPDAPPAPDAPPPPDAPATD